MLARRQAERADGRADAALAAVDETSSQGGIAGLSVPGLAAGATGVTGADAEPACLLSSRTAVAGADVAGADALAVAAADATAAGADGTLASATGAVAACSGMGFGAAATGASAGVSGLVAAALVPEPMLLHNHTVPAITANPARPATTPMTGSLRLLGAGVGASAGLAGVAGLAPAIAVTVVAGGSSSCHSKMPVLPVRARRRPRNFSERFSVSATGPKR